MANQISAEWRDQVNFCVDHPILTRIAAISNPQDYPEVALREIGADLNRVANQVKSESEAAGLIGNKYGLDPKLIQRTFYTRVAGVTQAEAFIPIYRLPAPKTASKDLTWNKLVIYFSEKVRPGNRRATATTFPMLTALIPWDHPKINLVQRSVQAGFAKGVSRTKGLEVTETVDFFKILGMFKHEKGEDRILATLRDRGVKTRGAEILSLPDGSRVAVVTTRESAEDAQKYAEALMGDSFGFVATTVYDVNGFPRRAGKVSPAPKGEDPREKRRGEVKASLKKALEKAIGEISEGEEGEERVITTEDIRDHLRENVAELLSKAEMKNWTDLETDAQEALLEEIAPPSTPVPSPSSRRWAAVEEVFSSNQMDTPVDIFGVLKERFEELMEFNRKKDRVAGFRVANSLRALISEAGSYPLEFSREFVESELQEALKRPPIRFAAKRVS